MAEENQQKVETTTTTNAPVVGDGGVEEKDRGLFDFLGKKEGEKAQEELIAAGFGEKVKVPETGHESREHNEEEEKEKKHLGLLEKISNRSSSSSSSSSSSDEECEGEERKKKKKERKKKQNQHEEDGTVPVERVDVEEEIPKEKKGFLDIIKEKLPGQNKMTEEVPPPPPSSTESAHEGGDAKEKKGFLDKIKEKLPGYHARTVEGNEKEKESSSR